MQLKYAGIAVVFLGFVILNYRISASNAYNMLASYNGFEAGMGIVIFSAFILFSLYYVEFLLKARGKLRPEWSAKLLDDGSLAVRDKVYSVPHIAILLLRKIKGKAFEYEVVPVVLLFQAMIALIMLYCFYS